MTKDIIRKLEAELNAGITTEAQVVYLLTAVRKLLEQQGAKQRYEYLTFHCAWALHSKLEGRAAQRVLKQFDAANIQFKAKVKLQNLPWDLKREIDKISKMEGFEKELSEFLDANGLPGLDKVRSDGWSHFLHLYAKVVEDCPLVMSAKNNVTATIDAVTVHMELANRPCENEMFYKINWTVSDKNGQSGTLFVMNSFSLTPQ
jgi:hypothetical protein